MAEGLGKAYGAPVLQDVSLELRGGEVHAVVGENGAGKSTLARIFAGLVVPDRGTMRLRGQPFAPRGRAEARAQGIAIVHQELSAIPTLSVAETLFLGLFPLRAGFVIDRSRLHASARTVLARVGLGDVRPERLVRTLGLGERQLLEIGSALAHRSDVLLLDEPTAALTPHEAEMLFTQIARLRAEGTAIVFISHRLEEVARIADRISVLRDGVLVATRPAAGIGRDELVQLMVGRPLAAADARISAPGEVALRVRGLSGRGFADVSFDVRHGEIVGLAGLMGAGRTEVLRAIFGADRPTAGQVFVGPADQPARIRSPRDAAALGLAFLTEDRKADGLLLPCSIRDNVMLGRRSRASNRLGLIDPAREEALVRPVVGSLDLRARSLDQPVAQLSGGNQQKVLLARWLLRDPDVFLVDEPTRGVDVGARAEVHRLLFELAGRGKAIVVASSEIDELFALCDRILVLSRGRLGGDFHRGAWSAEALLAAAVGGADSAPMTRAETA